MRHQPAAWLVATFLLQPYIVYAQQYSPNSQQAGPAQAGSSIVGAWSWQSPAQGGADQNSISFGADGTYLRVSRLVNGTLLRYWGNYRATPTAPGQVQLQSQTVGWLPQQICSQVPGFGLRCQPAPHPPEMSFVLTFTGPNAMQAEGSTLYRDASPSLLQQQVPVQAVTNLPPPVTPNIQQPVNPGGPHYQTPFDPGRPGGDDLQQQRICSINGGSLVRMNDGTLKCVN